MIPPESLHKTWNNHKPIIIEEDDGRWYEQPTAEFFQVLDIINSGKNVDPHNNPYVERYKHKGDDPVHRIRHLKELFFDIKENGINHAVRVEATGERLDGAFRTKIAMYLGIPEVPALLNYFRWTDISDDFIERKLKARILSSGKPDYYEFSYNDKWNNGEAGRVHKENAERWETILPLVGDSIIDLGCNEGYIALQLARHGKRVWGVDHDHIHLANLNNLIFSYIDQRTLNATFQEGDIETVEYPKSDTALLLNVIYHIPYSAQFALLQKLKGRRLIFQCNLRKSHVRDQYYGSHPEDLKELLKRAGFTIEKEIEWRDKPIIVAK